MNNQRCAVYSERRRILEGRVLKKQAIGYGERTIDFIVEESVDPGLPPEEWDIAQFVVKAQGFVCLFNDLEAEQLQGLSMEELKAVL